MQPVAALAVEPLEPQILGMAEVAPVLVLRGHVLALLAVPVLLF